MELTMDTTQQSRRKIFKIYTVIQKPNASKDIWLEIGVASENRDGSLSAKLDCLPLTGNLQIRVFDPKKNENSNRNSNNTPNRR